MKEKDFTVEQGFYQTCADLLNCENHMYRPFLYGKRTRWNNRDAGNGRYEGHGLIRLFAPNNIHVMLRYPKLNQKFGSINDALGAIKQALEKEL